MPASRISFAMGWICLGLSCSVSIAQQSLPQPIVLYRPRAAATQSLRGPLTITRPVSQAYQTQSPAFPSQNTLQPVPNVYGTTPAGPAASGVPMPIAASAPSGADRSPGKESNESRVENEQQADAREAAAQQNRPSNQMLQNPSGAYNFSHAGMTTGQQVAPNLYFGPQFQNWSNQQGSAQLPGAFGEMNRFQPEPSGGYVAPNTYLGSGYSSWNNLSSGSVDPNSLGGWSYSVWP